MIPRGSAFRRTAAGLDGRLDPEEGRMIRTFAGANTSTAPGCVELDRLGLLDTSTCCEICHSADARPMIGILGPCSVRLPDGREARVCCAAKKQLSERR